MLNLITHKIKGIIIELKKLNPFPYKLQSLAQRRSKVLLAETTVSSRYEVARSVTLRNGKPSITKKLFNPGARNFRVGRILHPNG